MVSNSEIISDIYDPHELQVMQIFFPFQLQTQIEALQQNKRFVHYTTAECALQIFQNKQVWMRQISCMNDYQEVEHGLVLLLNEYKRERGERFKALINGLHPKITDEIEQLFNDWRPYFLNDTYIACVSEHESSEDESGRLSMWRAYGQKTGVALVLNCGVFIRPTDALSAYASPVAYLDEESFGLQFESIINAIESNSEFVASLDRKTVLNAIFNAFRYASLCTKHPGFAEEREWRVVHSPKMQPSTRLSRRVEVISGVPQPVYKIPLNDLPDEGLVGLRIPELVDRVIIGPTDYPLAMFDAFTDALHEAGVEKPHERVFVSNIPLR